MIGWKKSKRKKKNRENPEKRNPRLEVRLRVVSRYFAMIISDIED